MQGYLIDTSAAEAGLLWVGQSEKWERRRWEIPKKPVVPPPKSRSADLLLRHWQPHKNRPQYRGVEFLMNGVGHVLYSKRNASRAMASDALDWMRQPVLPTEQTAESAGTSSSSSETPVWMNEPKIA